MTQRDHWEKLYASHPLDKLGWHRPHLETSLLWIQELELDKSAPIIDVGAGASTLIDDLIELGYQDLTALDLSPAALAIARDRLGPRAKTVTWLEADITTIDLPASHYDFWHDRAMFHFLTLHAQQRRYRKNLLKALKHRGHLFLAVFAPEGPPKSADLHVRRYRAQDLEDLLAPGFKLLRAQKETHLTPAGVEQIHQLCLFRKTA